MQSRSTVQAFAQAVQNHEGGWSNTSNNQGNEYD
jgi:hypothetical protein